MKTENLLDTIENDILELLPSGSGFDYQFEISWLKNGKCQIDSNHTVYNDVGYRLGYISFKATFFIQNIENSFKLVYTENRHLDGYGLKDYIEETIYNNLTR
tara:strand:- start:495 stop:800 length:306 start_codon:yes stop_codon:yes gene_type:complete